MTQGVTDVLGSQNTAGNPGGELVPVNVSVNANNQSWYGAYPDGDDGGTAPTTGNFVGTIQAYRFFKRFDASTIVDQVSYGSVIATPNWTAQPLSTLQDRGGIDIWTVTDPGADLGSPSTTADYNNSSTLVAGINQATGSIDITGLASGTVYFIFGGYRSVPDLDTVMKDTDGPGLDIEALNIDPNVGGNNGEVFLASVDFVNDAGYDTIDWTFTNTSSSGRARFSGIVVTGSLIPEPASLALLGLGGLMLAGPRRRKA